MKRAVLLLFATVFVVFSLSGVALAATPQEIYNDFETDRVLDGGYSDSELRDYLGSAVVHQYGDPTVLNALDSAVRVVLGASGTDLPFGTTQWILIALAIVVIAGGGYALRRVFRPKQSQ